MCAVSSRPDTLPQQKEDQHATDDPDGGGQIEGMVAHLRINAEHV